MIITDHPSLSGHCESFGVDEGGGFESPDGVGADLPQLDHGHYALTYHRGAQPPVELALPLHHTPCAPRADTTPMVRG